MAGRCVYVIVEWGSHLELIIRFLRYTTKEIRIQGPREYSEPHMAILQRAVSSSRTWLLCGRCKIIKRALDNNHRFRNH